MHKRLAHDIIEYLHKNNPDISIALSGSVSDGSYNSDSDIDLLIANKDFKNSYYIYFYYKGIKIGIFSYHRKIFWQNNLDYLYHFQNMRLSYIYKSQIRYDPYHLIKQLKYNVDEILQRRQLLKDVLISDLKTEIEELLAKEYFDVIKYKEMMYEVLYKIIFIFYLRKKNGKVFHKQESLNPYESIKEEDFQLYKFLKDGFPVHGNSQNLLKRFFADYILIHY